ncbi:hypothetical protein ACF3MZ_11195 [Paenibacillaceae bacterium WGS1546]|uniref:hypothetical protein n=1 Tax=Cohnella sp. WGS1546 TaxID=3366810 RepID=UPI00372D70D4
MIYISNKNINEKCNVYAVWRGDYKILNLTEKFANSKNIRKGALMAHLENNTGFKFSEHLHRILELINEDQDNKVNTGLYRGMSWISIFRTLKKDYNINFKTNRNKISTDEISINDLVFLVEYSEWLYKKYNNQKSFNDPEEEQLEWEFDELDLETI